MRCPEERGRRRRRGPPSLTSAERRTHALGQRHRKNGAVCATDLRHHRASLVAVPIAVVRGAQPLGVEQLSQLLVRVVVTACVRLLVLQRTLRIASKHARSRPRSQPPDAAAALSHAMGRRRRECVDWSGRHGTAQHRMAVGSWRRGRGPVGSARVRHSPHSCGRAGGRDCVCVRAP